MDSNSILPRRSHFFLLKIVAGKCFNAVVYSTLVFISFLLQIFFMFVLGDSVGDLLSDITHFSLSYLIFLCIIKRSVWSLFSTPTGILAVFGNMYFVSCISVPKNSWWNDFRQLWIRIRSIYSSCDLTLLPTSDSFLGPTSATAVLCSDSLRWPFHLRANRYVSVTSHCTVQGSNLGATNVVIFDKCVHSQVISPAKHGTNGLKSCRLTVY